MSPPDPYFCAAYLLVAFVFAGVLQAVWLYSKAGRRFNRPLDGGRRFRGQRIFGDNKTYRGFVVMVPGAGVAFLVLGLLTRQAAGSALWPIELWQFGLLGCWAGFGFMLAELPNSFFKRQLQVAPGRLPDQSWAKAICFVLDLVVVRSCIAAGTELTHHEVATINRESTWIDLSRNQRFA